MSRTGFAGALLLLAVPLAAQGDLAKGKQLFEGLCSRCHGFGGEGGEGPSLNRATLTRASNDESLAAIIRDGIPDRGMPRVRRMTDGEVATLTAYVRSLGRTARGPSTGNAGKGLVVYQKNGCSSCHIVDGEGGSLGPELSSAGVNHGPDYLRQAVLDPAASLPRGVRAIPSRGLYEYLPVRAVTREGREVRGARVNEDSFTIQIRDSAGQLHSLRKASLRTLDKELGKSLMPAYKDRIVAGELDDLVAYLASLGAVQ